MWSPFSHIDSSQPIWGSGLSHALPPRFSSGESSPEGSRTGNVSAGSKEVPKKRKPGKENSKKKKKSKKEDEEEDDDEDADHAALGEGDDDDDDNEGDGFYGLDVSGILKVDPKDSKGKAIKKPASRKGGAAKKPASKRHDEAPRAQTNNIECVQRNKMQQTICWHVAYQNTLNTFRKKKI